MISPDRSAARWYVVSIKWLRYWFVPPESEADWQRVSYQPMLYLFVWVAAIIAVTMGDVGSVPREAADTALVSTPLRMVWDILALSAPPAALAALWLVQHGGTKKQKYRGLWLRAGADMGQFGAMLSYCVARMGMGDYHLYPMATMLASTLFTAHLIMRDVVRLKQVEVLAKKLRDDRVRLQRK